jgi:hypothetical protein
MGCLLIVNEIILIFSYDVSRSDAIKLFLNDEYSMGSLSTVFWVTYVKCTKFDLVVWIIINNELAPNLSRSLANTKYGIRK